MQRDFVRYSSTTVEPAFWSQDFKHDLIQAVADAAAVLGQESHGCLVKKSRSY